MMDPDEDPSSDSANDGGGGGGGGTDNRGAGAESPTTPKEILSPTRRLRDKVSYYEKIWSAGGTKQTVVSDTDETDDALTIDVNAFEKRLKEESERRLFENSPKIEIKLRSTPQPSPRGVDTGVTTIPINLRATRLHSSGSGTESYEESVEQSTEAGEIKGNARIFKFEKVTVKKSVKEVTLTSSPTPIKTISHQTTVSRTPFDEQTNAAGTTATTTTTTTTTTRTTNISQQDDSAYETYHTGGGGVSSTSSTTILSERFPSEENIIETRTRRTPSHEKLHEINVGKSTSNSNSSSSSNSKMRYKIGSSGSEEGVINIPVAAGNKITKRQNTTEKIISGDSGAHADDTISPDWYNEYKTQSFQKIPARVDIKRTNSQMDTHIKEIRVNETQQQYVRHQFFAEIRNSFSTQLYYKINCTSD